MFDKNDLNVGRQVSICLGVLNNFVEETQYRGSVWTHVHLLHHEFGEVKEYYRWLTAEGRRKLNRIYAEAILDRLKEPEDEAGPT